MILRIRSVWFCFNVLVKLKSREVLIFFFSSRNPNHSFARQLLTSTLLSLTNELDPPHHIAESLAYFASIAAKQRIFNILLNQSEKKDNLERGPFSTVRERVMEHGAGDGNDSVKSSINRRP